MVDPITLLIVMIVVVFLVLILLICVVYLMGYLIRLFKGGEPAKAAAPKQSRSKPLIVPQAAPTAPAVQDGIDEETVAVITAAIMAFCASAGVHGTVRSISKTKDRRSAWSMAGAIRNTTPFSVGER